ncbi:hypothetical protein B0H11DRAFT_1912939 [Mycena galericulata]|nr:hypothetical protein B0H11DRAFT_1912939 [Mycena galericulata]
MLLLFSVSLLFLCWSLQPLRLTFSEDGLSTDYGGTSELQREICILPKSVRLLLTAVVAPDNDWRTFTTRSPMAPQGAAHSCSRLIADECISSGARCDISSPFTSAVRTGMRSPIRAATTLNVGTVDRDAINAGRITLQRTSGKG